MVKKKNKIDKYFNKKYISLGIFILIIISLLGLNQLLKPEYTGNFSDRPMNGPEDAKVKIVEYSDYQCPYCQRAHNIIKDIKDLYGDNVAVEFNHFPLRSIHPYAQKAAEASECANDQGKFWEYSNMLFKNNVNLKKNNLKDYAKELSLDMDKFNTCLDSGAKEIVVDTDYNDAVNKGLRGTPSIFINGEITPYTGVYEKVKSILG